MRVLYGGTIFASALLLLLVQPMMAKALLPWFGGSAGVWTCAMLFFQTGLLAGYAYAHALASYLRPRAQAAVHLAVMGVSLAVLPILPSARLAASAAAPLPRLLAILTRSVGLPYLVLATTTPLMQAWYARRGKDVLPYRLFAVSNAASLAALVAYPFAIEPWISTRHQMVGWSFAYAAFVLLAAAAAFLSGGASWDPRVQPRPASETGRGFRRASWLALAACPSVLWMSVANTLSQSVAPVPLLWIAPFSIYLATLVVCFGGEGWYRPSLYRVLLPAAWISIGVALARRGALAIPWEVLLLSAGLFLNCMFCHGELARRKPPAGQLTSYYLTLALGGALGGFFVAVLAPLLFHSFLELPIGVVCCVLLALRLIYRAAPRQLLRLAVTSLAGFLIALRLDAYLDHSVVQLRNFYGSMQVSDTGGLRVLSNGPIRHGAQFLTPEQSRIPTAYFGTDSGVGLLIRDLDSQPEHVGVIGLGAGTLAAYCRPEDSYRFYEINPAVIQVATKNFTFLQQCAHISVIAGDGRLALESEPNQAFDILVVDAFSGDSIPVHLLTREAFALYFSRLKADGALALHITNRYLDLAPVVAAAVNRPARLIRSTADPARALYDATWIVVTTNARLLERLTLVSEPLPEKQNFRSWTDDYSNLFQALR